MAVLNELNCFVTDVKPSGATRKLVRIPGSEYEVLAHELFGTYYFSTSAAATLTSDARFRRTSFGQMLSDQLERQPASAAILEERVPPSENHSAPSSGTSSSWDDTGNDSEGDYEGESPPIAQVNHKANLT